MGFGIFQKIYGATEGSRVQKISNGKSSNAETVFPILAGFTEGSQGSWEWYMKVKKQHFLRFLRKKVAFRYHYAQLFSKCHYFINLYFSRVLRIKILFKRIRLFCKFQQCLWASIKCRLWSTNLFFILFFAFTCSSEKLKSVIFDQGFITRKCG